MYVCACFCAVCKGLESSLCSSVEALEAVHSIQLVFLVRETIKAHSSSGETAASSGVRNRTTDTAVGKPANITAIVA